MEKINRRDYLLRMGVGVAGVIGAARLPLIGQKNTKKSQTKNKNPQTKKKVLSARELAAAGLRWPVIDVPPPRDAFVTAIYCGLIEFAYSDDRFMDVLFHPGMNHHKLEIQLYVNPPDDLTKCKPYDVIPVNRNDRLNLSVPAQTRKPDVFQIPGALERIKTGGDHDRDFRWLPDLHSLDFYPEGYEVKNVPNDIRMEVHNGTFYTRLLSTSTFNLVDAEADEDCDEGRFYGPVALCMATAIDAKSDVVLTLSSQSKPITFPFKPKDKYQVVFVNECESSCSSEPDNCKDETRRNDFHFSRKILKVPQQGRVKYSLKLKDGCTEDKCAKPDFCIKAKRSHRLTDEAPCMGAGFGKANGFS